MRILVAFFILGIACLNGFSQKDVEVYEKKEGEKTILIARNTGKSEYVVKLNITAEGMDVAPAASVEATVPGGFMKEMATITPRPGEAWSYSYDVSVLQSVTKPANKPQTNSLNTTATTSGNPVTIGQSVKSPAEAPALSDSDIVLYAKPGCGRCSFAKKQLNAKGIVYFEVDTHSNSPEVPNMWAQMRSQGFTGGSVTMPVIRVNGQYHYDIKDLESFIKNLKG